MVAEIALLVYCISSLSVVYFVRLPTIWSEEIVLCLVFSRIRSHSCLTYGQEVWWVIKNEYSASPVIPKNCTIWKTSAVWSPNIRYVMQIHEFTKCMRIHALEKDIISFSLGHLTSCVVLELLLFPFTNTIAMCRWIAWKSHTHRDGKTF